MSEGKQNTIFDEGYHSSETVGAEMPQDGPALRDLRFLYRGGRDVLQVFKNGQWEDVPAVVEAEDCELSINEEFTARLPHGMAT